MEHHKIKMEADACIGCGMCAKVCVAHNIKVLDKGIIKQLKTQGPTYNKTPPLETTGGVFVCKVRHGLTIGQFRALLDILSRG